MPQIPRRQLLGGVASLVGVSFGARSQIVDVLPWRPDAGDPPESPHAADWTFFTPAEAATVEAVADRFIPPDETTAGGKDAGCAAFVDRHVAGPYGSRRGLYVSPPFLKGQNNQGPQDQDGPPAIYRKALAALDAYARRHKGGIFAKLSPNNQDEILKHLERGDVKLEGVDGQSFFETLLKAIREGFFADPIPRRKPRHVRLEGDRLPRRSLRLPRLHRAPQPAIPARPRQHNGRARSEAPHEDSRPCDAPKVAKQGCRGHRPWLDRFYRRARTD